MTGLLATGKQLDASAFHPVMIAAKIAFGFVFIHPFIDGNGRLHGYLIHRLLAKLGFRPPDIICPVSAAILEHLSDYRRVLESYSHPLLEFMPWRKTADHNVTVLADTSDYCCYFDATAQAEFLFDCVAYTLGPYHSAGSNLPAAVRSAESGLDDWFQMSDKMAALLNRFLGQRKG